MPQRKTATDSYLADRLALRIAREQQFALAGRKLRNKSWLFRHEKIWMRPLLKASLQLVGLYERGLKNALSHVVRRVQLAYPHLPPAFDGYTLLHLSDLHIDGVPGLTHALRPVLAELEPDLCLITGDYRYEDEGTCANVYPLMREVLDSLSARDGVFAILGNHDVAEIAFALDDMGIRMLINEAVEIRRHGQSLWVAGIDDPFDYKCDDLPGTFEPIPEGDFKILMAHTPELYREAAKLGTDLYLSGHTHAGQIQLPLVGCVRHNCDCPKELAGGHWTHPKPDGAVMHGYTSAGVGCSALPIRFNCPPELILIELRSSAN